MQWRHLSIEPPLPTVIEPPRGWRGIDVAVLAAELWRHRDLLLALAARDVRLRYRQAVLGVAWAVVQPLLLTAVLSGVLGRIAGAPSDAMPYPVFVLTGLLMWSLFAGVVSNAAASLVGQAHLVSKASFPRLLVPLASAAGPLVDFGVGLVLLIALLGSHGLIPGPGLLLLLPLIAGVLLLAFGIGLALAALAVTYRDIRYVVPFLLQFGLFSTPVVYSPSLVPEGWRWLLLLNPVAALIDGSRAALTGGAPDWPAIVLSLGIGLCTLLAGFACFVRLERQFADVI